MVFTVPFLIRIMGNTLLVFCFPLCGGGAAPFGAGLRLFGSPQAVQRADYILPFSPRIVKRKALVNSAKFPARFLCNLMKNPAGGGSSPTICGAGRRYACPETSRSPPPRRKAHEAGRTTTKPGDAGFIGFFVPTDPKESGGRAESQVTNPSRPLPPKGNRRWTSPCRTLK